MALFLPFAVALGRRLERAGEGGLAQLSLAGALLLAVTALGGNVFVGALAIGSTPEVTDAMLMLLARADEFIFVLVVNLFEGLFVGAASAAILRSGALPRPLGLLGVGLVVVYFVAALWVLDGDFDETFETLRIVAEIGSLVWLAGTAGAMLLRGQANADAEPGDHTPRR